MNEKVNVQNLIDLLADKHGMSKKNADSFVKEFFLLIEEALEKDKYLKIKGLGTFKLIDVENRESVNVNTGERIEIPGYTKVSFTPENGLKELINKPFSHFEPVALNENTNFEDISSDDEEEADELEETNAGDEAGTTETTNEGADKCPVDDVTEESETKQEVDSEVKQEATESLAVSRANNEEPLSNDSETQQVNDSSQNPTVSEEELEIVESDTAIPASQSDKTTMRYFISIVIFVVLLCGGAVFFMYSPDLLEKIVSGPDREQADEESDQSNAQALLADSVKNKESIDSVRQDTLYKEGNVTSHKEEKTQEASLSEKISIPAKKEEKTVVLPVTLDSVEYSIVGTEATYTIKEGETLTKVALHFYGTKALWPYIVRHNPDVIKNPDHVPFGTTIKIPKLVKKQ